MTRKLIFASGMILAALLLLLAFRKPRSVDAVIELGGAPEEIGRQHATACGDAIGVMVAEYIGDQIAGGKLKPGAQSQVDRMKTAVPDWYLAELNACASTADIDPDVLLYAQCEGDLRSLPGCTTLAAVRNGEMQIGRNFDYAGLESARDCVRVFIVRPTTEGHHAFVSVGWTGILGGWTFLNEKGLFVANNLGGFEKKNPEGIPTLMLLRILAETCAGVDEAVARLESLPRMRGQVVLLAQTQEPRAAVVRYDAERIQVEHADDGFAFHSSVGADKMELCRAMESGSSVRHAIAAAGNSSTLHSVAIVPAEDALWVAHGTLPAHEGGYIRYRVSECFR